MSINISERANKIRQLTDEELVNVYELFKVAVQLRFLNIVGKVEQQEEKKE